MTTRQKSEFVKSLIETLESDNVGERITDAIINLITRRIAEKFNYYDAEIASLEAEIPLFKSYDNSQSNISSDDTQKKLER
ncbi:hypothetical protein JTB14_035661 [Gonioctena quinquepunctata]|nr:hypothetical protein JTB14_035661 [Gonioctena quinquepunctata]